MVSYICIVLYHLFYTVLACMISHNPHDCPFLLQVMDKEIGPGLTQGHRAGPGSTEGESLGRLSTDLGSVFCAESENTAPFTWYPRWRWSLKFTG